MDNIDRLKHAKPGPPKYRLANADVCVSPDGCRYIDHLDPVEVIAPEIPSRCRTRSPSEGC